MAEDRRLEDAAVEQRLGRLDEVLDRVASVPGPTAEAGIEAVRLLTEVYGEALARVLDRAGPELVERLLADQLVGHLLVLHELHPESVDRRVQRVLDELAPRLGPHDGELALLGVEGGVAHVQVSGGGGCGSSPETLAQALNEAVLAMAPELGKVLTEPADGGGAQAFIPVDALLHRPVEAVPAGGPG